MSRGWSRAALRVPRLGWPTRFLMVGLFAFSRLYRTLDALLGDLARLVSANRRARGVRHLIDPGLVQTEPDAGIGPILTRPDGPNLFRLLEQLARHMGGGLPGEVRIAFLPACGVLELRRETGAVQTVLIIGLPCLQIWTFAELRAVLAHELAHLKQEDAAFTREVLRFSDTLQRALTQHAAERAWANPRLALSRLAGAVLSRLAGSVSRAMEYRADRWSAELFGPGSLASAIEKLAIVQPIFREILLAYDPVGRRTGSVYEFFAQAWNRLSPEKYAVLKHRLIDASAARLPDPHPSLASRLARLRRLTRHLEEHVPIARPEIATRSVGAPEPRRSADAPALRLLARPEELANVLHNRLYGAHPGPHSVFQRFRL